MKHEQQVRVIERCLEVLDAEGAGYGAEIARQPIAHYTCPDRLRRERDILFRRFPIVVGFSSQVPDPGDYVTHDLTGVPLLIVRASDGVLRGFVNACRHRGARLARQDGGAGKEHFRCPFHGWTYAASGALESIPCSPAFRDLPDDRRHLVGVPVGERCGLVFAIPTPGATLDLDGFLGPLATEMEGFGFSDFVFSNPRTHRRAMNWKLHLDVTQEIYHLPVLHRSTAGSGYFKGTAALHEPLGFHARMIMPQESLLSLRGRPTADWNLAEHAGIVWAIFPNTTILYHLGVGQLLSAFPVAPDESILRGGLMCPSGPADMGEILRRKSHDDGYWATMEEDMDICESMQSTMGSGAQDDLVFGRNEFLLPHYHARVDDALEGRLLP
jgi:phenylpropionate dioxygenase-like ring-hydroxylating dioxygenase large terminal subunit